MKSDLYHRRHFLKKIASRALLLLFICTFFSGCGVDYAFRAAWRESKILWNRRSIDKILDGTTPAPELSASENEALRWVKAARAYAIEHGLSAGASYTQYSPIEGEAVSWVVSASPPLQLSLVTWWYPFVGSVPYRGFFTKEEALKERLFLEKKGLEASLRGVTAFSTLGWFNDPILTPSLKRSTEEIVITIIHELVHQTLWIPGSVELNESVAHFLSLQAAPHFFDSAHCFAKNCDQLVKSAQSILQFNISYSGELTALHKELKDLFANSSLTEQQKLQAKREIFKNVLTSTGRGGENPLAKSANNADFLSERLYHQFFPCFERTMAEVKKPSQPGAWIIFLNLIKDRWEKGEFLKNCAE